ncbi:MAG: hypothetical protein HZB31_03275 [Nitrospirae bacterium]|nr:hypothetical protein [Nitrospirota bacterium]
MKNSGLVIRNQKGIALVVAMLFSLILLVVASALIYTMASYFKALATAREKTQGYYVATAGVEKMRDQLWQNNCIPPNWCGQLGNLLDTNDSAYKDRTGILPTPSSDLMNDLAAAGYTVFLKDNDDGDNDFTNDRDQIIIAVATGTDGSTGTTSTIEAMLLYTGAGSPYAQLGAGVQKTGKSSGSVSAPGTIRQTL